MRFEHYFISIIHYYIDITSYQDVLRNICKSYMISRAKKKISFIKRYRVKKQILKKIEKIKLELEQGRLVGNCVTVSCWVFAKLLYSGMQPEICIGIRYADEKLFSHMWVNCENMEFSIEPVTFYEVIEKTDYDIIINQWIEGE